MNTIDKMRIICSICVVIFVLLFSSGGIPFNTPPVAAAADKVPASAEPQPLMKTVPPPVRNYHEPVSIVTEPPVPVRETPLLVNADNPLGSDYVPENLVNIGSSSYKLTEEAAHACLELLDAAKDAGLRQLYVHSGYRPYESQERLYIRKVNELKWKYGELAGDKAATIVARPGTSEHQSGLAVDISNNYSLHTSFANTDEGKWLAENAHKFGFILRYPKDKTDITGIMFEPWHFRYVGDWAEEIYESGLCLEEFLENHQKSEQSL